ncbi:MAG: hypothetical protein AAF703_18070 [Cyanobacteria bacterium P01_D01_bin.105]
MGWDVISKLFVKQMMWGGAITLGHGVALWRQISQLRSVQS